MKLRGAPSNRIGTTIPAAVSTALLMTATCAMAADADAARLASRYAAWAGGKANAEAIVNGLHQGRTITLVSTLPDHTRSLAGFTPTRTLTTEEVTQALSSAQQTLARLGIQHPTADQLQAALIGGEVALPNGRTRLVQGSVPPDAASNQIAAR